MGPRGAHPCKIGGKFLKICFTHEKKWRQIPENIFHPGKNWRQIGDPKKSKSQKFSKSKSVLLQIVGEVFYAGERRPRPIWDPPGPFFPQAGKIQKLTNFAYFPWWAHGPYHGPYSPALGPLLLSTRGGTIGISSYQQEKGGCGKSKDGKGKGPEEKGGQGKSKDGKGKGLEEKGGKDPSKDGKGKGPEEQGGQDQSKDGKGKGTMATLSTLMPPRAAASSAAGAGNPFGPMSVVHQTAPQGPPSADQRDASSRPLDGPQRPPGVVVPPLDSDGAHAAESELDADFLPPVCLFDTTSPPPPESESDLIEAAGKCSESDVNDPPGGSVLKFPGGSVWSLLSDDADLEADYPGPDDEDDDEDDDEVHAAESEFGGASAEGSEGTRNGDIDDAIEPNPFLDVKEDYESILQAIDQLQYGDVIEWGVFEDVSQPPSGYACGTIRHREDVHKDGAVVTVDKATGTDARIQRALNGVRLPEPSVFSAVKLHICLSADCTMGGTSEAKKDRWLCCPVWRTHKIHDLGCQDQWILDALNAEKPPPDPDDAERWKVIAAAKAEAKKNPRHPSHPNYKGPGSSTTRQMSKVKDQKNKQSQRSPGTKLRAIGKRPTYCSDGKRPWNQISRDTPSRSILEKLDIRTTTTSHHIKQLWEQWVTEVVQLMHQGQLENAQDKLDTFPWVHLLDEEAQKKIKKGRSALVELQIKKPRNHDGKVWGQNMLAANPIKLCKRMASD